MSNRATIPTDAALKRLEKAAEAAGRAFERFSAWRKKKIARLEAAQDFVALKEFREPSEIEMGKLLGKYKALDSQHKNAALLRQSSLPTPAVPTLAAS